MDTSLDQLLDMTIPCSSMQMQSFIIEHFMASPIQFLLSSLVKFSEHDMIGNFNGTVSNMK